MPLNYRPDTPDPGDPRVSGIAEKAPSRYVLNAYENGSDPIKFEIRANKINAKAGEEIQLTITGQLLSGQSNGLFFLQGSNAYTIKMLLPEGFRQTSGNLSGYVSDRLSYSSKPRMVYTVRGYFLKENSKACFRLIRSHFGAGDNSRFAVSATYCMNVSAGAQKDANTKLSIANALTLNWCAEAESGSGNGGAQNISGASGGQAVGGFGNSSEYKEYSITDVPDAGTYMLSLYYCSGETPQFGIVVNGTLQTASAAGNGSWTGPFLEKTVSVNLNSGTNTIRIQGNNGSFVLDRLCVNGESSGCSAPTLSLGTPTCSGSTSYTVSFTAQSGSTVTTNAGTVSGSSVINIPTGTGVTVTATSGTCSTQQSATPPSCGSTGVVSGQCYVIKSKQAVFSNNTLQAIGSQVLFRPANNQNDQIWKAQSAGSAFYFTSQAGNADQSMYVNSLSDGQTLLLGTYSAIDRYQWSVVSSSQGGYRVYGGSNQNTWDQAGGGASDLLQLYGSNTNTGDGHWDQAYRRFSFDVVGCPGGNNLTVSPGSMTNIAASGGSQSITVTSNVSWTVNTNGNSWLSVSSGSGSNNGSFTITVANNTGSARSGNITVSGGSLTQTISVSQLAGSGGGGPLVSGNCYIIKSQISGSSNTLQAGSSAVTMATPNSQNNQIWLATSEGSKYYFTAQDGSAKTMYVNALGDGEPMQLGTYQNIDRYQWTLESSTSGAFRVFGGTGQNTWDHAAGGSANILQLYGTNTNTGDGNWNQTFRRFSFTEIGCPSGCPTPPSLTLGTPTCSGTNTYSVSFTAQSGSTATSSAGTVSGSTVINIPVGTNVTVTATLSGCMNQQSATSPSNCNPGSGYARVFVFGNSITHNRWGNGTDWGMAASAANKDYFHILKGYLQTLNSGVDVREFASFTGTPAAGGIPLDIIDGPRWESEYWHLDGHAVYPGGITRYKAVQDWQPDLIIMRISENVTDWSHDFTTYYKQVIDYLKQQSPGCRVILTTSVWNQSDVSSLITSVGTERNYTVVNLNNITGAQVGEQGHPNDAAMQTIADRIWAGVQSTPPPPPPPDGFDWIPLASTSVAPGDSLVTFETSNIKAIAGLQSRFGNGGNITGPRLGGSLYGLFNKTESRFNYLSYGHYSLTSPGDYAGPNPGTNYTLGMGYGEGICLYMNPIPNEVPSTSGQYSGIAPPNVTGLGRNPYHGDEMGNSSKVLVYGKRPDNSGYYVKTQPLLYNAYGAYAEGTIFEEWRDFIGRYYITHSKVTTNYTSNAGPHKKQDYLRANGQEAPCIYVNGSIDASGSNKNKVFWYGGNSPCTGAGASNVDVAAGVEGTYMRPDITHVTEPFVYVSSGANNPGLCMLMESSRLRISKMGSGESHWGDATDVISPNTNATYVSQDRKVMLDNQGVYYITTKVYMADNLADARAQACLTANRFPTGPSYLFNKADRMGWTYDSWGGLPGGGEGKHTWDDPDNALSLIQQRGFWRVYFSASQYSTLEQSNISWDAASSKKIYIKMAYTGNKSTWGITWVQNEQLPNRGPSTPEEFYRFPKGQVPFSQTQTFSVNGDGGVRVYEIDLTNHSGWADKITEFMLWPHIGQDNTQGGQADIYWISTSPNGPAN